ncbi:MAG: hypothetical protein K2K84_07560, partial [Muribaculaceae bacterium]|nr:hypothetical protein [Muribaculaceae bacterium]
MFHYLCIVKHLHIKSTDFLYTALWAVVALLCLIDFARANVSDDGSALINANVLGRTLFALMPFFILFIYNNYLLIPRFLLNGHTGKYLIGIAVGLTLTGIY